MFEQKQKQLCYSVTSASYIKAKRATFFEPMGEKAPSSSFALAVRENMETKKKINGEAEFIALDRGKTIENLAKSISLEKFQEYKSKIETLIKSQLNEGETLETLWKHVEKQYGEKNYEKILMVVLNSLLKFYGVKKNGEKEEIDISGILDQKMKAHSSIGEVHAIERNKEILNTRTALSELLTDIQGKTT